MKQYEQDLQEYWNNYLGLKALGLQGDELAAKLSVTNMNMMMAYGEWGNDFLTMLQSLSNLSDEDKLEYGTEINMAQLEFMECVGGDVTNMQACSEKFSNAITAIYGKVEGDESLGKPDEGPTKPKPTKPCPFGSDYVWSSALDDWVCA